MNEGVTLFGSITRTMTPEIERGPFRFCLADIALQGRTSTSPLAKVALRHAEHSPLAECHNAHWVRGRLQHLFSFSAPPDHLETTSQVDNKTFTDRLMLKASFAAQTIENETELRIPFICTEVFSETCLIHGSLPDRNADRHQRMLASLTRAFVELLLTENELSDYDDYGVVFGSRFTFGIRDGVPYNYFPGSQR